jgi:Retrotransposon gag protein
MMSFLNLYQSFRYDDPTLILLFRITLKGETHRWYENVIGRERVVWKSFVACFLHRFNNRWRTPSLTDLLSLTQGETEKFCDYVDRWFSMADQVHQNTPPLEELIKIIIRSSRPPLRDLLATHTFRDFKELKTIGDNYEQIKIFLAPPIKRPRENNDHLCLQLGTSQSTFNQYNLNRESEHFCVYHCAMGHRTEFCESLRRMLTRTNETVVQNPPVNSELPRPL